MISKQLINKLKDFNLNTYESKIWIALLMKGSANAGKLSELTDVPRSRCYDVLESLEKKGFIVMKIGRPIKYIAVSPEEAIERTKQRYMNDAEEKIQLVDNIKKTPLLNELNTLHENTSNDVKPEELTGLVKSGRNVNNHLTYMVKNASKVYLSSSSKNLKNKFTILKEALKENPDLKIFLLTDNKDHEVINEFSKIADVRYSENISEFFVTDNQAALFLTESNPSVLWINSEYSVGMLNDLFSAKWASA